jgi:hypothetical protein
MGAIIIFAILVKSYSLGIVLEHHHQAADQYCQSIGLKPETCLKTKSVSEYVYSDDQGQVYIVSTSKIYPHVGTIEKYDPKIHRLKMKTKWE